MPIKMAANYRDDWLMQRFARRGTENRGAALKDAAAFLRRHAKNEKVSADILRLVMNEVAAFLDSDWCT